MEVCVGSGRLLQFENAGVGMRKSAAVAIVAVESCRRSARIDVSGATRSGGSANAGQ